MSCGQCENDDDDIRIDTCTFYSEHILLQCVGENQTCSYNSALGYQNILISSNITVNGSCQFDVSIVGYFNMTAGKISASGVNITALTKILIFSNAAIETSGRGPAGGAGSPTVHGWGGSYGGSGGRSNYFSSSCVSGNQTYFSNTPTQVGSIDVSSDLQLSSASSWTFGSGGGSNCSGSGRGGGRIILSSNFVTVCGKLSADGSAASNGSTCGSGSGGSISILSKNITLNTACKGMLTVIGGSTSSTVSGGAGGGGRISINIHNTKYSQNYPTVTKYLQFLLHGGSVNINPLTNSNNSSNVTCTSISMHKTGSTGTAYIQLNYGNHKIYGTILTDNTNHLTYAMTIFQEQPQFAMGLSASNASVISMTTAFNFMKISDCTSSTSSASPNFCSFIHLHQSQLFISTVTTASITSTQYHLLGSNNNYLTTATQVSANNITIHSHSQVNINQWLLSTTIICEQLSLSSSSSIAFTYRLTLNSSSSASLHGQITQPIPNEIDNNYEAARNLAGLRINSPYIHLGETAISNLYITTQNISIHGNIRPSNQSSTRCSQWGYNNDICSLKRFPNSFLGNNTVMITSTSTVHVSGNIEASAILICAENVVVNSDVSLSSVGLGCPVNEGYGAGLGGAGGSYGGVGNSGDNNVVSPSYGTMYNFSSGSGGGCAPGGGIIGIQVIADLAVYGSISSSGSSAFYDICGGNTGGGGAGGSVFLYGKILAISGEITANGGDGLNEGGGGGGGVATVHLSDLELWASSTMYGPVYITQGQGGSNGQDGLIFWPTCPYGYGGLDSNGRGAYSYPQSDPYFCNYCTTDTFSYSVDDGCCQQCTNAPAYAFYVDVALPDFSTCDFNCINGYVTTSCITPFALFLDSNLGGTGGFSGMVLGFLVFLIAPLLYFRFKRKYGWFEKATESNGLEFLESKILGDGTSKSDDTNKSSTVTGRLSFIEMYSRQNNIDEKETRNKKITEADLRRQIAKTFSEKRFAYRLSELDLPLHGCRVYLLGCNHPSSFMGGGAWKLSTSRPICLRPTLRREAYKVFAHDLTKSLEFNFFSLECFAFYATSLLVPPFAPRLMNYYRNRRAQILMEKVATCDHSFFKKLSQRESRNSLRIGISPDATLAYIDFLYDTESLDEQFKPLCPIGQAKLPVAFKLAGLGTYFSPWHLDTNDFILQSVPNTDIASSFIDKSWISFVVELNAVLRTVYVANPKPGLIRLMKFLSDSRVSSQLGGLAIELSTFANRSNLYKSDARKENINEKERERERVKASHDFAVRNPMIGEAWGVEFEDVNSYDDFANQRRSIGGFEHWFDVLGGVFKKNPKAKIDIDRSSVVSSLSISSNRKTVVELQAAAGNSPLKDTKKIDGGPPQVPDEPTDAKKVISISSNVKSSSPIWRILKSAKLNDVKVFLPWTSSGQTSEENIELLAHLSFDAMCEAVRTGKVSLGINVTHQKVSSKTFLLEDEDYDSEDEDCVHPAKFRSSDNDYQASLHDYNSQSDNESDVDSTLSETKARIMYGSKAEELAKFYDIMKAVDEDLTRDLKQQISVVDSSTVEKLKDTSTSNDDSYKGLEKRKVESPRIVSADMSALRPPRTLSVEEEKALSSQNNTYFEFSQQSSRERVKSINSLSESRRISFKSSKSENSCKSDSDEDMGTGVRSRSHDIVVNNEATSIANASGSNATGTATGIVVSRRDTLKNLFKNKIEMSSSSFQSNIDPIFEGRRRSASLNFNNVYPDNLSVQSIKSWFEQKDLGAGLTKKDHVVVKRRLLDPSLFAPSAYQFNIQVWRWNAETREGVLSISSSLPLADISSEIIADINAGNKVDLVTANTRPISVTINASEGTGFYIGNSLSSIFYFRLYDGLFFSLTTNVCFGVNVYPIGKRTIRKLLGSLILFLSCADMTLIAVITFFFQCASPYYTFCEVPCSANQKTNCNNYLAWTLMYTLTPGALAFGPLSGVYAIVLGPSAYLSRVHACWLRLSGVSTIVIIGIFAAYSYVFAGTSPYVLYLVIALSCSRGFQIFIIDLYIAHIERMRWSRGWDGLPTSLYVTEDNKMDIFDE